MKPHALALALLAAGSILPVHSRASDDFCSRLIIYTVQQVCQILGNGLRQCQPVGMAGPAPGCAQPGVPQLFAMPLAAPTIQMPPPLSMAPAMPNPYLTWSFPASALPAPNRVAPPPVSSPMPAPGWVAMPAPASQVKPAPASQVEPAPASQVKPAPASQVKPAPASQLEPAPAASPAIVEPAPALASAGAPSASSLASVVEPLALEPSRVAQDPPTQASPAAEQAVPALAAAEPTPASQAATVTEAVVARDGELDNLAALPAAAISATAAATDAAAIDEAKAHFPFDSAELTEVGRAAIDAWLAQAPRDARVRLTGHADRLGPAPYNLRLSQRRAEAVMKYLLEKGLDGAAIRIVAKGETKQVQRCPGGISPATIKCLAPNRRVEIDIE